MTREEIYREMEEELGLVCMTAKVMPDEFLDEEWSLWKRLRLTETAIESKYKELICLGIAAANHDHYGVLWATEFARAHGATDEEIKEAAYLARAGAGFLPYVCGNQISFEPALATVLVADGIAASFRPILQSTPQSQNTLSQPTEPLL